MKDSCPEPTYLPLGSLKGDDEEEDLDVDPYDRPLFKSCWHKVACSICCVFGCFYFLPMLSCIPMALAGGIKLHNPFDHRHNPMELQSEASLQPGTGELAAMNQSLNQLNSIHPKTLGTQWYWSFGSSMAVFVGAPITFFLGAYLLDRFCTFWRERSAAASLVDVSGRFMEM
mmetsp:Transcript_20817/g.36673  ORF Transcript_20817/g.36673 Transcript_20817/m.36673 type:complete len:172 (-) Transcript_20817:61-576(-)